jgi:hypothetical protein
MSVVIVSEEVAYLGQGRRIDFVETGECGFEGGSLVLQQLDNESDYVIEFVNPWRTWAIAAPTTPSRRSSALAASNLALLTAFFNSSAFTEPAAPLSTLTAILLASCTSFVVGAWTSTPNSAASVYGRSTGSTLRAQGGPRRAGSHCRAPT